MRAPEFAIGGGARNGPVINPHVSLESFEISGKKKMDIIGFGGGLRDSGGGEGGGACRHCSR